MKVTAQWSPVGRVVSLDAPDPVLPFSLLLPDGEILFDADRIAHGQPVCHAWMDDADGPTQVWLAALGVTDSSVDVALSDEVRGALRQAAAARLLGSALPAQWPSGLPSARVLGAVEAAEPGVPRWDVDPLERFQKTFQKWEPVVASFPRDRRAQRALGAALVRLNGQLEGLQPAALEVSRRSLEQLDVVVGPESEDLQRALEETLRRTDWLLSAPIADRDRLPGLGARNAAAFGQSGLLPELDSDVPATWSHPGSVPMAVARAAEVFVEELPAPEGDPAAPWLRVIVDTDVDAGGCGAAIVGGQGVVSSRPLQASEDGWACELPLYGASPDEVGVDIFGADIGTGLRPSSRSQAWEALWGFAGLEE